MRAPRDVSLPRSLYNEKIQSVGRTLPVPMDLKSTINLPKTGFPMKAGLPQNEPKMLARWEEQRIYDRIREARKGAPTYVLHDGPPYANGPIHLGHRHEQVPQGLHREVQNHGGIRLALRAGVGLPWPAHRDQSRPDARRQETCRWPPWMSAANAANMPRNFWICSASNSSASACSGASISPTPP